MAFRGRAYRQGRPRRAGILLPVLLCALAWTGCGGSSTPTGNFQTPVAEPCSAPAYDSTLPFPLRVNHAFVVVLENHSLEAVLDNPGMPYLNGLAHTYTYASGYFANTHPSLPNYFVLTTGLPIVDNDTDTATVTDDNIVRQLVRAGKTWKEYSEGLPSVGYDGGDTGTYIQHHNPLSYFSDVRNDSSQQMNLVPFTQLATDLGAQALPDYGLIVPDNTHNGHDCPAGQPGCTDDQILAAVDAWLRDNIAPLIEAPELNQAGGGVVIIVFDESDFTDSERGGGHILWVAVGSDVKRGYVSGTCYQHESTLRFMSSLLGLPNAPGAAATAADMREFLTGN